MQLFKILSATAGTPHFSRQVRFYCSGAQNFENCHGSLSLAYFDGKSSSGSKFQYIISKNRAGSLDKMLIEAENGDIIARIVERLGIMFMITL